MKIARFLCILFFLESCISSEDIPQDIILGSTKNIPVSNNVPNTYSYVLQASNFSINEDFLMQFDSDSFALSLVVGAYDAGSMQLSVFGENHSSQNFQKVVESDMVMTDFHYFKPDSLNLKFINFTGAVTLNITTEE